MKKIILFAEDYSSIPGVSGAIEIFNIANILSDIQNPGEDPLFDCSVVAMEKSRAEFSKGLRFEFDKGIEHYEQADAVVTTGFLYQSISHLEEKIAEAKTAVSWLRRQYKQGAIIGASCSGTILLAETGLLDGKAATTSWWLNHYFQRQYPQVKLKIDNLLVKDGRFITSGAITSYLNLILCLIERFAGRDLALSCSKMMLIDFNRFAQAPYMMLQSALDHSDDLVLKAQYWINEHLQLKFDLNELARFLGVSYRTLLRRFKTTLGETPNQYLQKTRIEAAKRLLETTDLNLEAIMDRVGYFDPSSFNLLFKRLTLLTPREYRLQFSINN